MSTPVPRPPSTGSARPRHPESAANAEAASAASTSGERSATEVCSLSVDDVVASHEGEWVLMKVTAFEDGWPSHGQVLAHSPSRNDITKADARFVGRSPEPGAVYYTFQAYRHLRTGAEMREALEALREGWDDEAERDWRRW